MILILIKRFIPTRRGNTPRIFRAWNGSSPHAGEIPTLCRCCLPVKRFIPTRRGNTRNPSAAGSRHPVHPHTQGKYGTAGMVVMMPPGSSPHAGEILILQVNVPSTARSIPTRGGNTSTLNVPAAIFSVHPHTRGKYRFREFLLTPDSGSSPHAGEIP